MVRESLIQSTTPATTVPVPRVITNESRRSSTTIAPLTAPIAIPAASAIATAHPTGHPWSTLRTAIVMAERLRTEATERS